MGANCAHVFTTGSVPAQTRMELAVVTFNIGRLLGSVRHQTPLVLGRRRLVLFERHHLMTLPTPVRWQMHSRPCLMRLVTQFPPLTEDRRVSKNNLLNLIPPFPYRGAPVSPIAIAVGGAVAEAAAGTSHVVSPVLALK
jgi:hypothetical protein